MQDLKELNEVIAAIKEEIRQENLPGQQAGTYWSADEGNA